MAEVPLSAVSEDVPRAVLENLGLTGTRITDAGLKRLSSLSRLERLEVDNTQVTKEGVNALEVELPNARIYGP